MVGHCGCSGVQAALEGARVGLADNWFRHIQDVRQRHQHQLEKINPDVRAHVLCDLNVIEQVTNAAVSTVMHDAWSRGQHVTLQGWTYSLENGFLQNLHMTVSSSSDIHSGYATALKKIWEKWAA